MWFQNILLSAVAITRFALFLRPSRRVRTRARSGFDYMLMIGLGTGQTVSGATVW